MLLFSNPLPLSIHWIYFMSTYHRLYITGGLYFFTLVTYERRSFLCEENALLRLKAAFRYAIKKQPFHITGLVILPNHLHCIWQLPKNDSDFSARWSLIKYYFSMGVEGITNNRREKSIWQKRFWEHYIKTEEELVNCLDYIHYNPVKHGYVNNPCDWTHSTFKQHVKNGLYTMDWASNEEPFIIQKTQWE